MYKAERAEFDRVCKTILVDMASNLGFRAFPQFRVDPQKEIKSYWGSVIDEKSSEISVDVAWKKSLPSYGTTGLAKYFFQDVVVAWEVDSSNSSKVVQSSIQNLDLLNPRLGIEVLLIGGNLRGIAKFESRYKRALYHAGKSRTRIFVLHDINFASLYNSVTGRHPLELYNVYIEKCRKERTIVKPLREKLTRLVSRSNLSDGFKGEIHEKFIGRIGEG